MQRLGLIGFISQDMSGSLSFCIHDNLQLSIEQKTTNLYLPTCRVYWQSRTTPGGGSVRLIVSFSERYVQCLQRNSFRVKFASTLLSFKKGFPCICVIQGQNTRNFTSTSHRYKQLSTPDAPGHSLVYLSLGAATSGKRFWKTVGMEHKEGIVFFSSLSKKNETAKATEDSILVTLDKRPLKTPEGKVLAIPKSSPLLAALIAYEWDNQSTLIKPFALPMVRFSSGISHTFLN